MGIMRPVRGRDVAALADDVIPLVDDGNAARRGQIMEPVEDTGSRLPHRVRRQDRQRRQRLAQCAP